MQGGLAVEIPVCFKAFIAIHGTNRGKIKYIKKPLKRSGMVPKDLRGVLGRKLYDLNFFLKWMSILEKKHNVQPVALASSIKGDIITVVADISSTTDEHDEPAAAFGGTPKEKLRSEQFLLRRLENGARRCCGTIGCVHVSGGIPENQYADTIKKSVCVTVQMAEVVPISVNRVRPLICKKDENDNFIVYSKACKVLFGPPKKEDLDECWQKLEEQLNIDKEQFRLNYGIDLDIFFQERCKVDNRQCNINAAGRQKNAILELPTKLPPREITRLSGPAE
ncbi:hypothetical protein FQR65_LT08149 [Abscondita terminalis]|nr:hypothetical protein FQR65_LT08149 [Abscondita terminalis]